MKLIAHNDGLELRGSERQLLHLAQGLAGRGHDVLVSCQANSAVEAELTEAGIATTAVRPRGDLDIVSMMAFRRLLAWHRPDAVLLTSWKRIFTGSWMARRAGVPRIVARLGIVRRAPSQFRRAWKLRRAFERQVDTLAVNSQEVARVWLDSAPWFPPSRIKVIHNAVEVDPGDPGALRAELGLALTVPVVASVGALEPRKGLDLVLRALAMLPQEVHAVIVGQGPEAGRLRELSRALGLEGRVHWLGARADVPDVLAGSNAFVLATRQDSIANAMLEAMALGVPVVTTAGNGAEEAIGGSGDRPPAGWIVPGEDPAALANGLKAALHEGADRSRESLWRAQHWFGVERMVTEYEQLLFDAAPAAEYGL